MKKIALFLSLFLILFNSINAQENQTWQTPMHEVKFLENGAQEAIMKVDPGFRYAELNHNERNYRLFYHHDRVSIKDIRIVDQDSKLQIARGRGSYFWGNARIVFVDGTEVKVKQKNFPNGYEVIGPYGPLFRIENHAFEPTKTYQESDFLTQAMFLFRRIRYTQKPPVDVVHYYTPAVTSFNSSK